jgi:hypothetical protein
MGAGAAISRIVVSLLTDSEWPLSIMKCSVRNLLGALAGRSLGSRHEDHRIRPHHSIHELLIRPKRRAAVNAALRSLTSNFPYRFAR